MGRENSGQEGVGRWGPTTLPGRPKVAGPFPSMRSVAWVAWVALIAPARGRASKEIANIMHTDAARFLWKPKWPWVKTKPPKPAKPPQPSTTVDDHVDHDVRPGDGLEEQVDHSRPVGHAEDGDPGLVLGKRAPVTATPSRAHLARRRSRFRVRRRTSCGRGSARRTSWRTRPTGSASRRPPGLPARASHHS